MDPRKEHSNEKQNISFDPPVGLAAGSHGLCGCAERSAPGSGLLLTIPAGLGGIAAAQEWSDYLTMKKHAAECAYHLSFSIFARSKWARLGTPPLFPGGPVLVWGDGGPPCGVSDSAGRSASMAPVFFPVFLPAQGRPGGAGPGFAFDGRSPSGSGPAGRAAAAGPAGLWCR